MGNPFNATEEACSGNVNCLRILGNSPYSCEVTASNVTAEIDLVFVSLVYKFVVLA